MTFRGTLRRCFVWLLCLSLCLGLAVPALAADNTGTEIRLLQTEGTVNVSSTSGKTYSTREDMRLYNGYIVSTEEASYAWITLDAEKAVKLDECSSLEVRRSGKSLELLLKSGEMYCDVTAPLKEDEKLNIRTSTMVTGVRGTIVYIQKISDDETHLGVLEGHAQGVAINPITGATRALMVRQGQIGVFQIFDADQAGEGADAWLLGMKADDIPPFVQVEIAQDPAARDRVPKDLQKTLTEALQDLLKKQAETRRKLEEIEELKEEEVISKDPLWEGEQGGGDSDGYTITWNIDGHMDTTTCKDNEMPSHAAPAKEGYIFVGWDPELAPAKADAVYTAVYAPIDPTYFEPEPKPQDEQYTITWVVDGVNYTSRYVKGVLPTRAAPIKDGYEFIGWDPEIQTVTGDATYTAVFEEIPTVYTITWQLEEGVVLETSEVSPGERPNYPGEEQPAKEGYRFVGWDPTVEEAWEDAVYTAVFEKIDPQVEIGIITWIINGEEERVEYAIGDTPTHEIPSLDSLVFTGWYDGSRVYGPQEELPAVTGDTTYTAEFEELRQDYTVTWVIDGESEDSTWGYGDTPSHQIPEKEPTEDTVYRFLGWSDGTDTYAPEELPEVTADVTYTAEYEESPREYTITWLDGDGNTLLEESVAYGDTPEYTGDDEPTKETDENYRYSFNDTWDPEIEAVTGEATYTAQFDEIPLYSVTVIDPENSPTMEADVMRAAEGDTVTVTVTADGYTINSVNAVYGNTSIAATAREDGKYTFAMPAADVTVRASLTAQTFIARAIYPTDEPDGFNTQIVLLENGDPNNSTNSTMVATDDTVTVRVAWASEYSVLDSVTMTWDGGSETQNMINDDDVDNNTKASTFTFTMPAGDAEFTANVSALYEIEIDEMMLSNAMISVNGSELGSELYFKSKAGKEVTLVITPNEGSAIAAGSKPSVTYTVDNTITAVEVSGDNGSYTFTMPEYPVSVNMNYVSVDPSDQATITISANGTEVTVTGYEALYVSAGTTVNVHAVVPEGEGVLVWDYLDSVTPEDLEYEATVSENQMEATYTFTMPENQIVEITLAIHGA